MASGFRCAYHVGMDQPHKLRRPLARQVVVNHPNGLHVRPSTAIVKTVRRFQSSVRIQYQDSEADAAEILDILALRVPQNAELVLLAEGLDARRSSMPSRSSSPRISACRASKGLGENTFRSLRTPLAPREGKHHAERDEYGSYSGRYPKRVVTGPLRTGSRAKSGSSLRAAKCPLGPPNGSSRRWESPER